MRSRAVIVGMVLGTSVVSGGWLMQRGLIGRPATTTQRVKLLSDVMGYVERYYVDTLTDSTIYRRTVDGLLSELHDPHSVFLGPDRLARLEESTTGRYAGVGIQIDVRDEWITIVSPLPGTPAEQAGVQTGDRVVEIDGKSTKGWTSDEAMKALRGAPGSRVHLVVERPGAAQRVPIDITRREIQFHVVRHALMLHDDVGYVDLTTFSESAASDLRAAVDSLRSRGMKTLIFDLRGDPGGLLDQGVAVADLFLDRGQRIVSMKGRTTDANREYTDDAPQRWPELRLIALIDSGSASASEIVAGALQDHDRALLLGTTSYGKGSAQSLFPTTSGGALKLTTALWYTPSGRSINRPHADEDTEDPRSRVTPELKKDVPTYRTDDGRTVLGGGGITPDRIIPDVVPTAADKAFETALGSKFAVFRDVLASYALSLKARHAVASPDFTVTPEMRDELYRRLAERDVHMDRATYDAARPLVDRWIGTQVARFVFGERAEFERITRDDATVKAALDLARGAGSQKELLEKVGKK